MRTIYYINSLDDILFEIAIESDAQMSFRFILIFVLREGETREPLAYQKEDRFFNCAIV